jgi:hypothetical protein
MNNATICGNPTVANANTIINNGKVIGCGPNADTANISMTAGTLINSAGALIGSPNGTTAVAVNITNQGTIMGLPINITGVYAETSTGTLLGASTTLNGLPYPAVPANVTPSGAGLGGSISTALAATNSTVTGSQVAAAVFSLSQAQNAVPADIGLQTSAGNPGESEAVMPRAANGGMVAPVGTTTPAGFVPAKSSVTGANSIANGAVNCQDGGVKLPPDDLQQQPSNFCN